MINSISNIEQQNINKFGVVTQRKQSSDAYWLGSQPANIPADIRRDNEVRAHIGNFEIITPEEARKRNNATLLGLSIAGAVLLTAGGIFFVLKGGPKGLTKNFQKWRNNLEERIQKAKLNNMTDTPLNRAYIFLVRKLDKTIKKTSAINNFTTFKDTLFKKMMYVTGFTAKAHKGITRLFEKIGRQAVINSYKKAEYYMDFARDTAAGVSMKAFSRNIAEKVEINGVQKSRLQWLEHALHLDDELGQIYKSHFGSPGRGNRYCRFKKSAKELEMNFQKLRIFWSKDLVNSFMAEGAIAKEKLAIQKQVQGYRRSFSYSNKDFERDLEKSIIDMTRSIEHTDIQKINMLRNLRHNIHDYIKTGSNNPELKSKIVNSINEFSTEISKSLQNKSMKPETAKPLLEHTQELMSSFSGFKSGKVEEILDIYRQILPPSEYETVQRAYRESVKSLDKAIVTETEDFISKVRDLTLGSAPTDILSVLGGIGTLGYYLGKSDNNDERISISLKYGIPALAGIGVALYGNAKLFAGTKSMIFGAVSTWIFNRIGSMADKKLKEHKQKATGNTDKA